MLGRSREAEVSIDVVATAYSSLTCRDGPIANLDTLVCALKSSSSKLTSVFLGDLMISFATIGLSILSDAQTVCPIQRRLFVQ